MMKIVGSSLLQSSMLQPLVMMCVLPHVLEVLDRFDMDPSVPLIGREQLRLEVHETQFPVPVLINNDLPSSL